jgi:N-acetylneuraminic acid mutarotase
MEALLSADRDLSLVVGDFNRNIWISVDGKQWRVIQVPISECGSYSVTSSSDGFIVSGGLANKTPKRECYAYVTHTRQWRTLPPMSVGRYYHSSICDQDEFIVIGGRINEKSHLDSVECLNLKTLEWSQFPDLPQARCLSNLLHVQNQLFVVGGYLTKTTTARDIYKFDSTEREWQTGSPLPEKCGSAGAVSFDNKIFVVGGQLRSCKQYDPCTDRWVQLPRPRFGHAFGPALTWKDKIIVCGGRGTDSIEEFDPQSDKWSTWGLKVPKQCDMCFALITNGHQ